MAIEHSEVFATIYVNVSGDYWLLVEIYLKLLITSL